MNETFWRDAVLSVPLFFSRSFLLSLAPRARSPLGPWGHGPSRELTLRLAREDQTPHKATSWQATGPSEGENMPDQRPV